MIDITTTYMGLPLRSPIVASASPMCDSLENIRRFEESGVGAVVLPSLFEEQLEVESDAVQSDLSRGAESFPESLNYFPSLQNYNLGPDAYLELIRKARTNVSIPVIASLNGTSPGGWTHHAKLIEQAGASALELNIYDVVADVHRRGSDVEDSYCELVRQVKASVRIPVAVKISPFFTAMANIARRLDNEGADGLVLFNRFYQPDIDIDALEIVPSLILSQSHELALRLHWAAILYGSIRASMAVTGGVHTGRDVLKAMMAGANVAMMTSAFFQNGIRHANVVLHEISRWMEEHEYESIEQMRGSMSRRAAPNPSAFDRANYIRVLSSYTLTPRRLVGGTKGAQVRGI
jgi:dihydroorotate dehydrogenase (fumarate)